MNVKDCFLRFLDLYIIQLVVWPLSRLSRVFTHGDLAMYLLGGVTLCGGLGIIFAWLSNSFDPASEQVLHAMIVFVPSIVGTSFFDLVLMLSRKRSQIPTYIASWLMVLAIALLITAAVAYFKQGKNQVLTYWVWGLALALWTVINADDAKFAKDLNPKDIEGGDAMRPMKGFENLEGINS